MELFKWLNDHFFSKRPINQYRIDSFLLCRRFFVAACACLAGEDEKTHEMPLNKINFCDGRPMKRKKWKINPWVVLFMQIPYRGVTGDWKSSVNVLVHVLVKIAFVWWEKTVYWTLEQIGLFFVRSLNELQSNIIVPKYLVLDILKKDVL